MYQQGWKVREPSLSIKHNHSGSKSQQNIYTQKQASDFNYRITFVHFVPV